MNEALLHLRTMDEMKDTVFGLGAIKSPGPDGLPGLFYQKYCDIIKLEVLNVVQTFFQTGFLLKALNETNISLVPKVLNPEYVGDLRPISCANFSYKIISKFMASRLKPFMPYLISQNQSGFIG